MKIIDATHFKEMLVSAANNLEIHREEINTLNVFPVPDGDTGTNMNMTFGSGVSQAYEFQNDNIGDVAKCLSRAMLMGARGNSGVILSQIFKGFAQVISGSPTIDVEQTARAFVKGSQVADRAVMKPVEGTILTVIRDAAEECQKYAENEKGTVEGFFETMSTAATKSLKRTPELLPILKEAGVVDSGGAGLCAIIDGINAYWQGNPITKKADKSDEQKAEKKSESGYCTDVVIAVSDYASRNMDLERVKSRLARVGDKVSVVEQKAGLRIHIHTAQPGEILNQLQRLGEFTEVRIQNMSLPYEETAITKAPHEEYALITVCNGSGIEEMFRSLQVNHFVTGGQTMNPSTESFVNLIGSLDADHIIVLPNNSNIVLAATQAKDILSDMDINIVPSSSIPQGLSACIAFDATKDVQQNIEAMNEAIKHVKTGEVTYAVKNTTFDGVEVKEGDFIGLFGKKIASATPYKDQTAKEMLNQMIDSESTIVTLIYGEDISESEAMTIEKYITDNYHIDVQTIAGHQDIYSYIIGVE